MVTAVSFKEPPPPMKPLLPIARALAVAVFAASAAPAQAADAGESGQRLPRFVSLRATQVNLRSGPGVRYPIEWVYLQRDLPVEVIQEFDHWRKIRDWEGTEGWVHRSMLSGNRAIRIVGTAAPLRAQPQAESPVVAQLEGGVVGRLVACPENSTFCRVEAGGYSGWLPRAAFWGAYRGETVK
jgi:SH3-like domain-containing protein